MRRAPESGYIGRCQCGHFVDADTRELATEKIHKHARLMMLRDMLRESNAKVHGSTHFISMGAEGDRHRLGCRCGWSSSTRSEMPMLEEAITHLNTTDWMVKAPAQNGSPKVSHPTRTVVSRGARRPAASKTKRPRLNPPAKKRIA